MPGVQHRQATTYRLYRSTPKLDDAPPAGCLATVTVDFDGADPQRQQDWVNSVFAAANTDQASLDAGLIAAHFHVSLDGTRVLNLAEWTTARAHRQARDTAAHHHTAIPRRDRYRGTPILPLPGHNIAWQVSGHQSQGRQTE